MSLKIAIQGIKGSNHHQVPRDYFVENIELVECMSFDDLVAQTLSGRADKAVMAIENSIAGSIIPNYNLVFHNNLHIIGEHYLNIHHNLMVLKGQKIEDITEVHSHPMALLQCHSFFKNYPHIKLIEDKDTASVAKRIHDNQLKGVGAIASDLAANIYNLNIIAPEIQTIKDNSTRFFILAGTENRTSVSSNKASIKFITSDDKGSLATVLTILAKHNLNLSKIQSMPVIDTPWKYAFFADFIFESYADYYNAIVEVKKEVETLTVLGEYNKSKR